MKTITFYQVSAPYGWMSNFAPYPIELDGKVWPTSEHNFQAANPPTRITRRPPASNAHR